MTDPLPQLVVGDLTPEDDLMHPVSDDPSHNESMFFNFFDTDRGVGGFVRLGNRPNEGHAEMTFCTFLADGSVLFQWGRPEISGNGSFDGGGLRFTVEEPGRSLRISYAGEAVHLKDPQEMRDPGPAMRSNPRVPVELELHCLGTGPMIGSATGDPRSVIFLDGVGHYQQPCSYSGHLTFAGTATRLEAVGVRDHSWGRRVWQDLYMDRSYWVCFGTDLAFIACKTWNHRPDVQPDVMGCVVQDGGAYRLREFELRSWYEPGTAQHRAAELRLVDERGREWLLRCETESYVPLRHRKPGRPTVFLGQAPSRFTLAGRSPVLGLSEYFDVEAAVEVLSASPEAATEGVLE